MRSHPEGPAQAKKAGPVDADALTDCRASEPTGRADGPDCGSGRKQSTPDSAATGSRARFGWGNPPSISKSG